jgi:hypothetical protein
MERAVRNPPLNYYLNISIAFLDHLLRGSVFLSSPFPCLSKQLTLIGHRFSCMLVASSKDPLTAFSGLELLDHDECMLRCQSEGCRRVLHPNACSSPILLNHALCSDMPEGSRRLGPIYLLRNGDHTGIILCRSWALRAVSKCLL